MDTIIYICAIYGLAFIFKDAEGPWGIMSWLRSLLMSNKYVGVWFYKLFSCYFCVGFHAGWIVYLWSQPTWAVNYFILWALAGGVISLIFDAVLTRLSPHQ